MLHMLCRYMYIFAYEDFCNLSKKFSKLRYVFVICHESFLVIEIKNGSDVPSRLRSNKSIEFSMDVSVTNLTLDNLADGLIPFLLHLESYLV